MGKTQRKLNGQWVDVEDFEAAAPVEGLKPSRVVDEAREVLARGDFAEMGEFWATYVHGKPPRSTDARRAGLQAFIEAG